MTIDGNGDARTLLEQGLARHRAGQFAQAEQLYRRALSLAPGHPDLLHLVGVVAGQQGRTEDSVALLSQAVAANGRVAAYHSNLGAALRELGRLGDAAESLMRAIALDPSFTDAHANLGAVRHDQGRFKEAEAGLRLALARDPRHKAALVSLGVVLRDQGQLDQAEASLRTALARDPTDGEAAWALAATLLVGGRYREGWAAFEARWRRPGLRPRRIAAPRWQGDPLDGRTILLHSEQGRGDTIQFARFTHKVRDRGGRTILQVQPELVGLLRSLEAADAVVPDDGSTPACDCHCPLLSLPLVFNLTLEDLPGPCPYLRADKDRTADWIGRLGTLDPGHRRRVGLVFAGTPTHRNDRNRSIPPAILAPLLDVPDTAFFALQVGPRRHELAAAADLAARIPDLGGEVTDFADTAALLSALDLLVTVDTAAAHLAGALGRPAWVLLPYAPDWRWLLDRADTPWYPSVRLFRQPRCGDWQSPVAAVAEALINLGPNRRSANRPPDQS